jgi:hypothetical protein
MANGYGIAHSLGMKTNTLLPKLSIFAIVLFTIVGLTVVSAAAQTTSGNLVGTVVDASGAAVPNADVTATNVATNVASNTKSNSTGEYRFNNLPVGSYDISANAAGFQAMTLKNYQVELNKTSTAKLTLAVGQSSTSVEVDANATVIDTTTAQIQNTFEQRQNENMPTASVGSGVINLSLLNAGVGSSGGVGAGTGPSVGGQRPRNNNFTVEGIDNNSKSVTGPNFTVPGDAVSNFTVMQNQFNAEFGHSSGGQFNQVVDSGTNKFHGSLYEYFRNRNLNAIDANIARNTIPGTTPTNPRFDDNRFGGKIGGPIVPNKLFFFFLYEFNPTGQSAVPNQLCGPTAAGYTALAATPGLSATNLAQFKQYMPVAPTQDLAGICPTTVAGSTLVNGVSIPIGLVDVVAPNFVNGKSLVSSIDFDITSSDKLRGRYLWNNTSFIDTAATLPAFYLPVPVVNHLFTLSEYHTFSPTVQNELRLGFNRNAQTFSAGNFTYPGLDSFPNIEIDELGLNLGPDANAPQFGIQNYYTAADNLSWLKGNHDLRVGYQFAKYISPQSFTQRARGDYDYSKLDLFLRDVSPNILGERSLGDPVYYGDQIASYWYINDNWKIRPNFTLNLGLRHEYTTIPQGERLQSLNQAASVPGLIDFSEPRAPKTNFMPRVGFAWSPRGNQNTSIRGGFSIAYDVLYDNIGILSLPPQLSGTIDTNPAVQTANFLGSGGIKPSTGGLQTFPDIATQRANTANHIVVDQKNPYSESWNLGVQHAFGKAYTAEVRYVGTKGIHLNVQSHPNTLSVVNATRFLPTYLGTVPSQATLDASPNNLLALENVNPVVPAYDAAGFNGNIMTEFAPLGSSIYHGLQTQLNRQFTNGLQFTAAYTWSRTIDDSTADFFTTVLTPRRGQDFLNLKADRSVSALSRTHRFTFSALYETPWFKNSNWLARNVLGNWTVAPIYTYESPEWATVQSVQDSNLNVDSAGDRTIFNPSGVPGTGSGVVALCTTGNTNPGSSDCSAAAPDSAVVGYRPLNPNAQYIVAGLGALANAGRNTLPTRPINNVDLTMGKDIGFTENTKLQFQARFFNLLNHPQFIPGSINDVASIGNTSVRTSLLNPASATFNKPELAFASNARTMQLVIKFIF